MTLWINLTYWIVTCWYQFIGLTIVLNCVWTVVYYCIVVFIYWLIFFICDIIFNLIAIDIYIVNINITFRLFFKFVDVSDVLITFDNFTCCSIIACPVTLWINLTYWIVTCWYQFIGLTIVLNCVWTVVYYCIVVFIYWLIFFICDIVFNFVTIDIYIVNINITFWKLINIGNVLISFFNLTSNWICTCNCRKIRFN